MRLHHRRCCRSGGRRAPPSLGFFHTLGTCNPSPSDSAPHAGCSRSHRTTLHAFLTLSPNLVHLAPLPSVCAARCTAAHCPTPHNTRLALVKAVYTKFLLNITKCPEIRGITTPANSDPCDLWQVIAYAGSN